MRYARRRGERGLAGPGDSPDATTRLLLSLFCYLWRLFSDWQGELGGKADGQTGGESLHKNKVGVWESIYSRPPDLSAEYHLISLGCLKECSPFTAITCSTLANYCPMFRVRLMMTSQLFFCWILSIDEKLTPLGQFCETLVPSSSHRSLLDGTCLLMTLLDHFFSLLIFSKMNPDPQPKRILVTAILSHLIYIEIEIDLVCSHKEKIQAAVN
jgi:hypothetical protein